jgi:hypothetical protein
MLIIGESGAGKTTLISTLPADKRVLIISAENGMMAIRDALIQRQDSMTVCEIDDWKDLMDVKTLLKREKTRKEYDVVVFDSLTAIGNACFKHMGFSSFKPGKDGSGDKKDGFKQYADTGTAIIDFVTEMNGVKDYMTIMTCLGTLDDSKEYVPLLPGRMAPKAVKALFDVVLFITCKTPGGGGSRIIYTDGWEGFPAKDRTHKLAYLESPNLEVIEAKIMGLYEEPEEGKEE